MKIEQKKRINTIVQRITEYTVASALVFSIIIIAIFIMGREWEKFILP